eukprot:GHVN01053824.1.p1 GENE.GHVN01053824.1~~GHVN01053824.1.p1  ORF type:complete len:596 (+),score=80.65 GHVN01053824.1:114-1901(+)
MGAGPSSPEQENSSQKWRECHNEDRQQDRLPQQRVSVQDRRPSASDGVKGPEWELLRDEDMWRQLWKSHSWSTSDVDHARDVFKQLRDSEPPSDDAVPLPQSTVSSAAVWQFMVNSNPYLQPLTGDVGLAITGGKTTNLSATQFLRLACLCDVSTPHEMSEPTGQLRCAFIFVMYDEGYKGFWDEEDYAKFKHHVCLVYGARSPINPLTILDLVANTVPHIRDLSITPQIDFRYPTLGFEIFKASVENQVVRGTSQLLRANIQNRAANAQAQLFRQFEQISYPQQLPQWPTMPKTDIPVVQPSYLQYSTTIGQEDGLLLPSPQVQHMMEAPPPSIPQQQLSYPHSYPSSCSIPIAAPSPYDPLMQSIQWPDGSQTGWALVPSMMKSHQMALYEARGDGSEVVEGAELHEAKISGEMKQSIRSEKRSDWIKQEAHQQQTRTCTEEDGYGDVGCFEHPLLRECVSRSLSRVDMNDDHHIPRPKGADVCQRGNSGVPVLDRTMSNIHSQGGSNETPQRQIDTTPSTAARLKQFATGLTKSPMLQFSPPPPIMDPYQPASPLPSIQRANLVSARDKLPDGESESSERVADTQNHATCDS